MRPVYFKVYNYGRQMGTYTATDLQQMIHCGRQVPGECADTGRAYRGRYTFNRVVGGEDQGDWSRVTEHLRSSGYDLGRIRITKEEPEGRRRRCTKSR